MMPRGAFMPPWPRVFQPDTSTTFSPALRKTLARSVRYIRSPFRGHEKGAPEGAPLGMGVSGGSARYDGGEKPPSGKQDRAHPCEIPADSFESPDSRFVIVVSALEADDLLVVPGEDCVDFAFQPGNHNPKRLRLVIFHVRITRKPS